VLRSLSPPRGVQLYKRHDVGDRVGNVRGGVREWKANAIMMVRPTARASPFHLRQDEVDAAHLGGMRYFLVQAEARPLLRRRVIKPSG
jgi:hypothetical protein